MKTEIFINPTYQNLEPVIQKIPQLFGELDEAMHMGRNEVKVLTIDNTKFVIKRFKKITVANRIIYRFFRKSKAQRSYFNAVKLLEKGINTPEPIAYIDQYSSLKLRDSYFVSAFVDAKGIDEVDLEKKNKSFIVSFAQFLYYLHQHDVFHQDLNISNVLVEQPVPGTYQFYLIDNNRMRFRKPNKRRVIKNLRHLGAMPLWAFMVLVDSYAHFAGVKSYKMAYKLLVSKRKNHINRKTKSTLKKPLKLAVGYFKKLKQ